MESTVLSIIGEHIHGPEFGKEEVFEFSAGVRDILERLIINPFES